MVQSSVYTKKDNALLAAMFAPLLAEKGVEACPEYIEKVVGLMKERVNFVKELWDQAFFCCTNVLR